MLRYSNRVFALPAGGVFQGLDKSKKANKAAWIFPRSDKRGFNFRFNTGGATDGLTFKTGPKATAVQFKLITGQDDDPTRIFIGFNGIHSKSATFKLPAHPAMK
ncbi:MAG: hypothetical protein EXR99_16765 [Gemmataceae bacterium]|nr:hypothetical protein [Gemmataceae bacterium]